MHKIKNLFRWLLFVGLALGLAWSSLSPALAVSGDGVSIFPARTKDYPDLRSWFVYEVEPGIEVKDKVELINNTSKATTLLVAVLDGAVTSDGGYTLVGGTAENKDLGTWATLSEEEVSLPPRSRKIIDMTIKVPEGADVGSHPGGVVVWRKPEESTASKKGSQLSVVTRVAARVYLTVPGDIQRILEVTSIKHQFIGGVLHFILMMQNKGNVQLQPQADISLKGLFGSLGTQPRTQFGLLLRGSSITSRAPWQGDRPKFGRYVADFRIHYGEVDFKNEYVKDEYIDVRYVFWVLPWFQIIVVIGIILLLLFLRNLWLWLVIQQRLNTKTRKHVVKKGETLTSIASHYNVHPKNIAKFNLLKWPYELTVGDTLMIPQGKMTKVERLAMGRDWNEQLLRESRRVWLTDIKFAGRLLGKIRFRRRAVIARSTEGDEAISKIAALRSQPAGLPRFARNDMKKGRGLGMTKGVVTAPMVATESVITERGDTIKDVAEFAGVSMEEIIRLNDLRPPYRLRAGQEMLVPLKRKAATKPKRATKKPTESPAKRSPKTKNKRRK